MGISMEQVVQEAEAKFGARSVMRLTDKKKLKVPVQRTGVPQVDLALGVGGLPKGRIVEILGPESCLWSETFIQFNMRYEDGRRISHKGGTIARLYERFKGISIYADRRGMDRGFKSDNIIFTCPSCDENNRIVHNRIIDVIDAGLKPCFKLTTENGSCIIATAEHEFYTENGFIKLSELKINDLVCMHKNTPYKSDKSNKNRIEQTLHGLKYHPIAGIKNVNGYLYTKMTTYRAIVEADMNGIDLETYIKRLNSKDIKNMKFLSREQQVHHIDGNKLNNKLENLFVCSNSEHRQFHVKDCSRDLNYIATNEKITSIEYVEEKRTFDIKMQSPLNNFVADKFIVHNSGKTTLALTTIAQAQASGSWAWVGDMEHALDPVWCEKLGVNIDKLLISQPNDGNECLDIAQYMARTGVIDIMLIDSVAALVPKAELEGESGDAVMGLQARMMSQACRKLTPILSRMDCLCIFINQIREKIGVVFGSPETTPGGRALKFYASIRIDIRRTGSRKEKEDIVGSDVKIKIIKNKVAPPFKMCEAVIDFKNGFDLGTNLLDTAVVKDVISKSGNTYSYGDKKLGVGRAKAIEALNTLPKEELNKIYEDVSGKAITSKKVEPEEGDPKERLLIYTQKLAEAETDEDKEKYKAKIDKIKNQIGDEEPLEMEVEAAE